MAGKRVAPVTRRRHRVYGIYGLRVRSVIPLPCQTPRGAGPVDAEVVLAPASLFAGVAPELGAGTDGTPWFGHLRLPDGSEYLRWSGLFEFLIAAAGRRIACRPLGGAAIEAFRTYLLGHVLSFALLKRGVEPLHATAVAVNGAAVAFVGDCGYGKSSLGAAFLQAGYPLLTDDLLVVQEEARGFLAYPGVPRIKLFPESARGLLRERITGTPMNNLTPKLVIPLERKLFCQEASRLKAIYVLASPRGVSRRDRITIRPLSPRQAFLELLKNTFNTISVEPGRLRRQFDLAGRLASEIPVKSLSYPRTLARLPAVREAIERDLCGNGNDAR